MVTTKTANYDLDFYQWSQHQAALLRQGALQDLDVANLAEEVESLGKRDRRALGSHLRNLALHLLKWHYHPEGRALGHSWASSIRNARAEISAILDDSPSLRRELPRLLRRWYPLARLDAADETHLPVATFPEDCPWAPAQLVREDFWPESC